MREERAGSLNDALMYDFRAKSLTQIEPVKQFTDHMVKEIKSLSSWDTDVQVHIEPEAKDKRLFSVSLSVFGLGQPIVISKQGKNVMAILRKVCKGIMRQVHRISKKRISHRRKHFLKEQFAS